ncbi:MAG TPA: bifunctional lysylphosphatidylglycerol flippase/synthetase MprF [Candidatus Binatia bacterium]|jgi:phosphatidylglycerol lysyltransferase
MKGRPHSAVVTVVGLAALSVALWVIHRRLGGAAGYEVLVSRIASTRPSHLWTALMFSLASYGVVVAHDALALRQIHRAVALPRIALGSFANYMANHSVGPGLLGGALTYRILTAERLAAGEIADVMALNLVTFWLAVLFLGGAALVATPLRLSAHAPTLEYASRALGAVLLTAGIGYWTWMASGTRNIRLRGFDVTLPHARLTSVQIALSSVEWALGAAVLYRLLPATHALSFSRLIGIFVVARTLGLLSCVPAGLGVFDAAIMTLLAPYHHAPIVLAALLLYRAVYLAPPAAALVGFTAYELTRRGAFARARNVLDQWWPEVAPRALAVITFAGGMILLISGARPGVPGRMELLNELLPLPLMEISHFAGSIVGVGLLLLARALQQRIDAAYYLTISLLVVGVIMSLLKGLNYEEAIALAAIAIAVVPCRPYFYRRSSLFGQSFSMSWILAVVLALVGTWVAVAIAYRDIAYSHELWWQFEISADAPRALRALAGACGLAAAYSIARLFRPAPPVPAMPSVDDIRRVAAISATAHRAIAHLALLGSNRLLFHDAEGFLMYDVRGRSWVAMADPFGPPAVRRELAWHFHELADEHGGSAVFYEVSVGDLPIYLDLGLKLYKLGEEARIPLEQFTLSGRDRQDFRTALNRMARTGGSFAVIPAAEVPSILDPLETISNEWVAHKTVREKQFSMGYFDRAYLARTPVAVVRQHDRIVAFANLWAGVTKEEMSVDLVRYADDAPSVTMDYLFTQLIMWGQAEGYRWFSLGMAPLSGFERRRLAPNWTRLGRLLFRFGDQFYNFRGLRRFKEKFGPVWEPRYLACPGGLALPFVLTDVAALIGGGIGGVIHR